MPDYQHWSYDLLKSMISQKNISPSDLEGFKELFRDEIPSTRRYASIKTLEDLLDCLERRDSLSEYNIDPLRTISEDFADDEIDIALEKYHPPENSNDEQNIYALQRKQEERIVIEDECKKTHQKTTDQKPTIVMEFTQKKRDQIVKLIARDIGSTWRFLGRELSVRAGDLDRIDAKHPKDLQSRVYEIFQIFENDPRHNPKEHFNIICDALDNCRRKDIRRSVQKILTY